MKKVFRHIGYYNDIEDVKVMFTASPHNVVSSMLDGIGHFYKSEGEEDSDIENVEDEKDSYLFKKTADGQYLVRYERGNDDGEGWYIDIYKLTEVKNETSTQNKSVDIANMVKEYCGHCEEYVYLEDELKVQVCPNCGKAIVPCSICPMLDEKNYHLHNCSSCPLGKLCEEKNGENYVGEHLTLMETAYKFNTAESNERECGLYITIPKLDDGECDEEIYLHYNKEYECVMILDVAQYGLAYSFKKAKIDRLDLHNAITKMFGRCVEKVYVRMNY